MAKTGPKPSLELIEYAPATTEEMLLLEEQLLAVGVSPQRAARIPMRLHRLWKTGIDGLCSADRSNYRDELKKIGAPPWGWGRASELAAEHRSNRMSHGYP